MDLTSFPWIAAAVMGGWFSLGLAGANQRYEDPDLSRSTMQQRGGRRHGRHGLITQTTRGGRPSTQPSPEEEPEGEGVWVPFLTGDKAQANADAFYDRKRAAEEARQERDRKREATEHMRAQAAYLRELNSLHKWQDKVREQKVEQGARASQRALEQCYFCKRDLASADERCTAKSILGDQVAHKPWADREFCRRECVFEHLLSGKA